MIQVWPVMTESERSGFLDLPFQINRGDPCWNAPFHYEIWNRLDAARHPFYRHARPGLRRGVTSEGHGI
jgi:hypothetical protein